jgi:hypothetical protein
MNIRVMSALRKIAADRGMKKYLPKTMTPMQRNEYLIAEAWNNLLHNETKNESPKNEAPKNEIPFDNDRYMRERFAAEDLFNKDYVKGKPYLNATKQYLYGSTSVPTMDEIISRRPAAASRLAQQLGLVPGSDEYNRGVKYFM